MKKTCIALGVAALLLTSSGFALAQGQSSAPTTPPANESASKIEQLEKEKKELNEKIKTERERAQAERATLKEKKKAEAEERRAKKKAEREGNTTKIKQVKAEYKEALRKAKEELHALRQAAQEQYTKSRQAAEEKYLSALKELGVQIQKPSQTNQPTQGSSLNIPTALPAPLNAEPPQKNSGNTTLPKEEPKL